MRHPDVIILGAGAAGLAAAQVLSESGCSAVILEGRDRVGGRIVTIPDKQFPIPVQMGPEFIHGNPKVTWDLVRRASLVAYDLPDDHRLRRRGHLVKLEGSSDGLGTVMGGLTHLRGRDKSFAQYLRDHHGSATDADARKFAISFVEGFDAADPERISARSLAEEQAGIADVDEETQFRLVAGYGALVEYLQRSLDPKRIQVRLNTLVGEIAWSKHAVKVQAVSAGRLTRFTAPALLITAPVGVLQAPPGAAGAIGFSPELPEKRRAAMQLGSGPIVKGLLKFNCAFWEEKSVARSARSGPDLRDAVFLHDPDAAFPTVWTARPLHVPVLTVWAGGPKAVALSGLTERQVRSAALDTLAGLFGRSARRLESQLEAFHFYDWAKDPLARGAYSYVAVGGTRARGSLAKPVEQTLFFAGEATDTSGQASTVAGAIASGQRAATELMRVIRR